MPTNSDISVNFAISEKLFSGLSRQQLREIMDNLMRIREAVLSDADYEDDEDTEEAINFCNDMVLWLYLRIKELGTRRSRVNF